MYDELIKLLRCPRFGNCPNCPMWFAEEVEPNLWRERCAAIDAADAIEELIADRDKYKRHSDSISHLPDCNTCGKKAKENCEFMPRCGDWVRINCAFWTPEPPKEETT